MNNSSLWIILQRMRLPFTVIVLTYAIAMIGLLIIPGVDNQGNTYHLTIFDAFYFTSYTATTIGFGEIPYPLTYPQKMWVSVSIYLSVLGWFYGIGTLVSLLQDKLFLKEIARAKFVRSVKKIKEDFVIILGYNETTSQIIKKMIHANMRVVVIEKEQQRADYLHLEGFIPHVPVLVADVYSPNSLECAGIKSIYCKGIISLFQSNILNMRVTLASRLLNSYVTIAVRSGTDIESLNLLDAGATIVEKPLEIIAYQLRMALNSPSLFKLENWLYGIDTLDCKTFSIPKEKILICGYGRLGKKIYEVFVNSGIIPIAIDLDMDVVTQAIAKGHDTVICGNAEEKSLLEKINIKDMNLVIVATNNDTTNLSIVSTVRKVAKNTMIVARENELSDFSIFSTAKIDHIFLPDEILIRKTTNAIINPLSDKLIRLLQSKDEQWGHHLLSLLIRAINANPITFELNINKTEAIELYNYLKNNKNSIIIDDIRKSRRDRSQFNNIVPLLITRDDEDRVLPSYDMELKVGDKILFACDQNSQNDLEYIVNNVYEFHYIITGKERSYLNKFISRS